METPDNDPNNPTRLMAPDEFPTGAVLTVAFGSNERPFTTLGNLYRVLAFLTGDGVPSHDKINDVIGAARNHVLAALPTELRAIDPPPADDAGDAADVAWVGDIGNRYGHTMRLTPLNGKEPG